MQELEKGAIEILRKSNGWTLLAEKPGLGSY
ncbi:MAG: hypothetical protein CM1200mP28_02700 [Deltaproteobacteria bacterium]|nr:MAG: hypothetical protein CM1200mP28_02700 [Deltaproteobacteria bacterium]